MILVVLIAMFADAGLGVIGVYVWRTFENTKHRQFHPMLRESFPKMGTGSEQERGAVCLGATASPRRKVWQTHEPFRRSARSAETIRWRGYADWAFAHVLPGARIGRDCNICDHVFIENDVVVGDRVTVKCGVQFWDGLCGGDVFIGPNATFTNDQRLPAEPTLPGAGLDTHPRNGASIGGTMPPSCRA